MIDLMQFRRAVAPHLGEVLTPEVAAAIELASHEPAPDNSIDPAQFGERAAGAYTIRAERCRDALDDVKSLNEQFWAGKHESESDALEYDYDALLASERAGNVLQIIARRDGEAAAVLRLMLARSMRTQRLFAEEDMLFLAPKHRPNWRLPVEILRFASRASRILGVNEMRITTNKAGALLRRVGAVPVATQYRYVKYLEETQ